MILLGEAVGVEPEFVDGSVHPGAEVIAPQVFHQRKLHVDGISSRPGLGGGVVFGPHGHEVLALLLQFVRQDGRLAKHDDKAIRRHDGHHVVPPGGGLAVAVGEDGVECEGHLAKGEIQTLLVDRADQSGSACNYKSVKGGRTFCFFLKNA